MLTQIFEMQHELNKVIGRDTANADNKKEWFFQYTFAALEEVGELHDSKDENEQRIELIDIIHFWASMCHILDIDPGTVNDNLFNKQEGLHQYGITLNVLKELRFSSIPNRPKTTMEIYLYRENILKCWRLFDKALNCCSWKWWSKDVKSNPELQFKNILKFEEAIAVTTELYRPLMYIAWYLNMSETSILDVYKKKCQVNHDRQKNGYDVRTKTEEDNQAIMSQIQSENNIQQTEMSISEAVRLNDLDTTSDMVKG